MVEFLANLRWCIDVPVKFIFLHLNNSSFWINCIYHIFTIYVDLYARNVVTHILHDFVPDLNCNTHSHTQTLTHTLNKNSPSGVSVCLCLCVRTFYLKLAIFVYNTHAMYIFFTEVMINLCTLSLKFSVDFSLWPKCFTQHTL